MSPDRRKIIISTMNSVRALDNGSVDAIIEIKRKKNSYMITNDQIAAMDREITAAGDVDTITGMYIIKRNAKHGLAYDCMHGHSACATSTNGKCSDETDPAQGG